MIDQLAKLGSNAIIEAIDGLANHTLKGEQQNDNLATYAHKLTKEEAQIDWEKSAVELENTVRAFNPWPICHTLIQGQPVKILEAKRVNSQGTSGKILEISKEGLIVACGSQALCLTKLQLPNSKPLPFWDVYNGHKDFFDRSDHLAKNAVFTHIYHWRGRGYYLCVWFL